MSIHPLAMGTLEQLPGFKSAGKNQYQAKCPAHKDDRASLSIGIGNDGKILLHCFAGCELEQILEAIGIEKKDLFENNGDGQNTASQKRIIATYNYTDIDGNLSYQVLRYEPKDFKQRRPDGKGDWIWKTEGLKRLPYNLPELLKADYVWIPEGEKDCKSLGTIGLTATTNDRGAEAKWTDALTQYFRPDQHVTILPDNDDPGRDHADQVAQSLFGKVASLKILELAGLPEKGDVSDWLQGRDRETAAEELSRLADAAPEWEPSAEEKSSIIHWAREALEPQPAKDWIIAGLIGAGDVAALIGDAGSKKTRSSIDLAVCVASGKEWLGKRVSRSRVLIVDEESGPGRLKHWLGDTMRAHEAGPDLPIAFTTLAGITLATQEGADCLRDIIRETEARFIVMDALQDFTLNLDENSGKELAPVIHRLKVIAEKLNCAIWLIHHLNKQGAYRGHSSIKGLIDVMLKCESQTDSGLIQFTAEKSRDSLITPFAATAHFDIGRFWLTDAEPKATSENLGRPERYVTGYLMKQPDRTAKISDILSHADICTESSARTAIYNLADRGKIIRIDDGRRGQPATYKLANV